MSEFRFMVIRDDAYDDEPERWRVELPHQCDNWSISGGYAGQPHADAVASLETFITEAQEALTALRAKKEQGNDF